ncbi:hypothetical protein [Helicobacter marmotae]|uniref:hypothetical protein n=1 Tax=Helicobacter marmotae TaxID=152490 RepID=UPI001475F181|nr:hypothetical protein [Helicobacter marmotae]
MIFIIIFEKYEYFLTFKALCEILREILHAQSLQEATNLAARKAISNPQDKITS